MGYSCPEMSPTRRNLLVCFVLVAITLVVYGQVWRFGLVDLDDDAYISHNPYVQLGVTSDSVRWAFGAIYEGNWHPMVWLSYFPDTEIARIAAAYGVGLGPGNAGVYHLSNLFEHIASTLMLFFIMLKLLGSPWRSAFVAAIFAIHPLHVESVAWATERKDTLSALFWMLTTLAYLNYVRGPGPGKYALLITSFAMGLMSKSMLVTLPIVLLLMDYWPLRRIKPTGDRGKTRRIYPLVREKIPLFALSTAAAIVAFIAQRSAAYVAPEEAFPIGVRLANAFVSCIRYIWLTILPRNLSPCYLHPGRSLPVWIVLASGLILTCVTVAAIRFARRIPYLTVGWFWFLITLLPVIGLVQVGAQSMADRYTYIPMIGLLVIAVCGVPDMLSRVSIPRYGLAAISCAAIVPLMLTAHRQVGYWSDSVGLYRRIIRVSPQSHTGYSGLGAALAAQGKTSAARRCLRRAIELDPTDIPARINLGISLAIAGKLDQAGDCYRQALDLDPNEPRANYNLGNVLVMQGKLAKAAGYYRRAIASRPSFVEAHVAFANASAIMGRPRDAIEHYREAIRLNPNDAGVYFHLAGAYEDQGRIRDAIDYYRETLRLAPKRWDAANNLAWILATNTELANPGEAVKVAENACRGLKNPPPALLDTLAAAYAACGRYAEATDTEQRALAIAVEAKQTVVAKDIRSRLKLYQAHRRS